MATRVYSPKAYKSDDEITEGLRSPIPKPRPKKDEGRSLSGIMGATPSKGREASRRKLTPATGTSPKPKPKSERHVHASTTTPSRSSPPPKKGRSSGMYSSKASRIMGEGKRGSKSKSPTAGRNTAKKAAQLKRSKAWAKRYGDNDRPDRGRG